MLERPQRIKKARKAAGLTQAQLAKRLHITTSAVGMWETGSSKSLRPEHLFGVAEATGFSAEWLANGTGPEKGEKASFSKSQVAKRYHARLASLLDSDTLTDDDLVRLEDFLEGLVAGRERNPASETLLDIAKEKSDKLIDR